MPTHETPVYVWDFDEAYPEKAIAEYDYERSPDRFQFTDGRQVILDPSQRLIFKIETPLSTFNYFDHIENNANLPLISPKLQVLFDEYCSENIQYLDTVIYYQGGETTEYKAVNITHTVISVDRQQSEYSYIAGTQDILFFKRLTLLPNCLRNHQLARMEECPSTLLVSAKLSALFIQYKIKGVALVSPQESTELHPNSNSEDAISY